MYNFFFIFNHKLYGLLRTSETNINRAGSKVFFELYSKGLSQGEDATS